MMGFDDKYFVKFKFGKEQVNKKLRNAIKGLDISKKDRVLDVKFNYTYKTLIKLGIALLSFYQRKIKSVPGHNIKIIDTLAELLKNQDISDLGHLMT